VADALLALLLRQTLVLSLAWPLVLGCRALLLRHGSAGLACSAWALLPLLMLAASLPGSAPGQALAAQVWAEAGPLPAWAGGPLAPASAGLAGGAAGAWLALWAAGGLAGLLRLAVLHRRYVRSLWPSACGGHLWAPAGSGPALLGAWRPRLVLPQDFAQRFSPAQQLLVRCHEAVHAQRHDNAWNLLATLLCLLQWFNPLAWWALRRFRADQELACDAAVMAHHPGSQAAYGHALLQAQGAAALRGLPWSHWVSVHPLTERIAMLQRSPASPWARRVGGWSLLLLGLAGAGAVHAWRAGDAPAQAAAAGAPPAEAASAGLVDVAMDLTVVTLSEGGTRRAQTRPRMRLQEGQQGQLIMNGSPDQPTAEQVVITLKATPLSGGRWQLDLALAQGLPLQTLGRPRLVVQEGETGRVEVGQPGRQITLALTTRRASASVPNTPPNPAAPTKT
jgi:beta-lactamase regulating signal transducer with metallopeptidase domain